MFARIQETQNKALVWKKNKLYRDIYDTHKLKEKLCKYCNIAINICAFSLCFYD